MDSKQLRKIFLTFFKKRGHTIVPSSSLVPDDPSVLLTTAGMQQFKRYYTGELNPHSDFGAARTVSIQKCFRTSDVEEVGDASHLTFFEMLGNFSFGPVGNDNLDKKSKDGYFKRSAIVWGYEFLVGHLGINPERIWVTVFEGDKDTPRDEESYNIWRDDVGIPKDRIFDGSRKNNFWGPTGNEGPCGPTTEIYVSPSLKDAQKGEKGEGVEVWNIVFNEYYATPDKDGFVYKKVDNPGIDTGMGLERLLAVLEGKTDVFETSPLEEIVDIINEHASKLERRDVRILADHIRSAVFLIGEGVESSNKERGYVLRRLLRKIIGLKVKHDIHADIFEAAYHQIKARYGSIYSEIKDEDRVLGVWREENSKFQSVIAKGIKMLNKYKTITGKDAFYLYESFGLPFELTKELAPSHATKNLRQEDFEKEFEKHQRVSRAGVENKFGGHGLVLDTGELKAANEQDAQKVIRMHTATHLLQWALRKVLGEGVVQMGSDINPKRLRFDFSFERKITDQERQEVEDLVNKQIQKDLPVHCKELPKQEAEKEGALAFFGAKYPDTVKVYYIGSEEKGGVISKEFCGGPHVESTGQIGTFRITKEKSSSKGVRRIRAEIL